MIDIVIVHTEKSAEYTKKCIDRCGNYSVCSTKRRDPASWDKVRML